MPLSHILGLFFHSETEWHDIAKQHETLLHALFHIAALALLPVFCAYVSTSYIGWSVGGAEKIYILGSSAVTFSVILYFSLLAAVFALAGLVQWMAKTFGASPSFTDAFNLAAYSATPMLIAGTASLYPSPIVFMLAGLIGLAFSVRLLYLGTPIVMKISQEQGFLFSSSVVTSGLVLLIVMLASVAVFITQTSFLVFTS